VAVISIFQIQLIKGTVKTMIKKYAGIGSAFEERAKEIESIFTSFRTLHTLYATVMKTANVNSNARTAFERAEKSAMDEQDRISKRLYAQGFTLLTGSAEALVKDVFESLLIENFPRITGANGVNFSIPETQRILASADESGFDSLEHLSGAFGRLARTKLYKNTQNPAEKINFQNAQQMVSIFKQYFGIDIDMPETISSIHRHWQVRHCIVHTNSILDERFVQNVKTVNLLRRGEKPGKTLVITKSDYQGAKTDFMSLFEQMSNLITKLELQSRFVSHLPKTSEKSPERNTTPQTGAVTTMP